MNLSQQKERLHGRCLDTICDLLVELQDETEKAVIRTPPEQGWDLVSRIATALGMTPPPDDDGFWRVPGKDVVHSDDLPHVLPEMVRAAMDDLLTKRVHPSGPLTLEKT